MEGNICTVNTVRGKINVQGLGNILPHEHIVIYPLDQDKSTYEETYGHFVPIYRELVEKYNCRTVVELTPRLETIAAGQSQLPQRSGNRTNFDLLREISQGSGMNIVLCTGYYLEYSRPDSFKYRAACDIAGEMVDELVKGINGTDIKAGIIKIAINGLDSASDRKLLAAAAIAQKETGVSISTHTCSPSARLGALDFLEGAGVDPGRIYLGHADANSEIAEAISLVKRGCSLLYTVWGISDPKLIGWTKGPLPKHHSSYLVKALIDEGYAGRVLLSVDYAASYQSGRLVTDLYDIPGRTSLYAFTFVVPSLKRLGVNQPDIDRIMMENPKKMLLQDR